MTMPAASPTSMTLSFTVLGGGPRTGTKPPVALPGSRRRAAMNLSNSSRRFPRNRSQVPRPTFAHPAFGMIHAYPPGARLPKNMSVASLNSPSAVALMAGADTGHSRPTDFATVDRGPSDPMTTLPWNVPWFVSTSSPRTPWTVVSVMSSAPSCTGRPVGPGAADDHVVGRGPRAVPAPVAGEDVVDELDHVRFRVALPDRVQRLLRELSEGERLRAGLLDGAGIPEEGKATLDVLFPFP